MTVSKEVQGRWPSLARLRIFDGIGARGEARPSTLQSIEWISDLKGMLESGEVLCLQAVHGEFGAKKIGSAILEKGIQCHLHELCGTRKFSLPGSSRS